MAEGGQISFPGRDLEEENKALRAEIERLRRILASNGLTSASALPIDTTQICQNFPNSRKSAKNE